MADLPIWLLTDLPDPIISDIVLGVDSPGGTPATRKIALSAFAPLVVSDVVVQVKTVGSGTYTPTTGMKKVLAIGVGGGGGGGGGLGTDSAGGGGGGGGACIRLFTAAEIGASKAYVVGAKGLGATSAQAVTAGTATTLDAAGALLNAGGGPAGVNGGQAGVLGVMTSGVAGGTAANGDLNIPGGQGQRGVTHSGTAGKGGSGGHSYLGFGGGESPVNTAGALGTGYGAGGGGGAATSTTDKNGADGSDGILWLLEFVG